MGERYSATRVALRAKAFTLSWPDYPSVTTTLLAAAATAAVFVGIGTLTVQPWVTWLGLLLAAGVLLYHLWRVRRVQQTRGATQAILQARLIGRCTGTGGPQGMQGFYDGRERIILVLTDDALHVGTGEPFQIVNTFPLYDVVAVESNHLGPGGAESEGSLQLRIRPSGSRDFLLSFRNFEGHVRPAAWAAELQPTSSPGE